MERHGEGTPPNRATHGRPPTPPTGCPSLALRPHTPPLPAFVGGNLMNIPNSPIHTHAPPLQSLPIIFNLASISACPDISNQYFREFVIHLQGPYALIDQHLHPGIVMGNFGLQLVSLLLMLVLLPACVSANAGPETVSASTGGGPAWAAPGAVLATLSSLSLALQSLFNRLASARLARGDAAGAERARNIANTVGNGLQWWAGMGTVSWDYVTNYVFTQSISRGVGVSQALGQLSSLSALVGEVTQLRSDGERLQWLSRNYTRAFAVAKSVMANLLTVFHHDGIIRNCVLAIQRELLEGDLLRDVLRMGPNDLEGIVRMLKDVLQRTFVTAPVGQREGTL